MKKQNEALIKDIQIFIEYSVERTERQSALDAIKQYEDNSIVLSVIRDFYARLPEFREEAVATVSPIVSRYGAYLLDVSTKNFQYLYFFQDDTAFYLGEKKDGIGDNDVLNFFGFETNDEFLKTVDDRSHQYADFKGKISSFCPACAVAAGEFHHLGCPVEICPWCDGQLNICNCRFEQLGVDEITEENEIDRLETLLNDKGRIPFSADHAPAYPTAGEENTE